MVKLSNSPIVKVCGMRDAENILAIDGLSVDLMGFIFWPKSSRYVSERPSYLPTHCKRVGVFVDATIDEIRQKAEEYRLDFVQLHGHETPELISHLSLLTPHLSIIKAISVSSSDDIATYKDYEGLVDYFLFDTKCTCMGGSGQQFDWSVLNAYDGTTPFLLSGGIGPNDAERVKDYLTSHLSPLTSHCVGIDLNSRFEQAPALKDINKLKEFINTIRL